MLPEFVRKIVGAWTLNVPMPPPMRLPELLTVAVTFASIVSPNTEEIVPSLTTLIDVGLPTTGLMPEPTPAISEPLPRFMTVIEPVY